MDKEQKERAVMAANQAKQNMSRDTILSEGMKIRRRSWALFLASFLGLFLLKLGSPFIDFPVLAFMCIGYIYSRSFYSWEKKNAAYLRRMGFTVKGG